MSSTDDRRLTGSSARRPHGPDNTHVGDGEAATAHASLPIHRSLPTVGLGSVKRVCRGIGRATRTGARLTSRTSRAAGARFHAYTHSGGAGETGLARVTELHASHTAGDTIMMLALAGTLFFNPQTAQARSQVALFLVLTMVPFLLVAPLIGPLLDRFSHGRRWAIGTTLAGRAFLCWVLGEAIVGHSSWVFPAALGCLVASKAYTITRAAAVPRLLPPGTTLVNANSRVSMAGVIGAVVGGAIGAVALIPGPEWALRLAFVVFVVGTVQAIRLPARVDSSVGERDPEETAPIRVRPRSAAYSRPGAGALDRARRRMRAIPWPVRHAMWSAGGTRLLTGFLLMFMAFLVKEHPIDGVRAEVALVLLAVAIGVGNALGSALGHRISDPRPERIAMLAVLVATLACIATALWYSIATLLAIGFVQGLSAQLAKLGVDALVQRDVPENVRTSVFAWSETMLQTLWVVGGALGIIVPLNPHLGFPVCAAGLVACVLMAAHQRRAAGPLPDAHLQTDAAGPPP